MRLGLGLGFGYTGVGGSGSPRARFTGIGSLTTQGALTIPAVTAFTGVGTLSTLGSNMSSAMSSFTGTGTMTTAATLTIPGSAEFAATGTLTTAATLISAVTTAFTGTGTLTTSGDLSIPGVTSFTGTGTLASTGTVSGGFTENGVVWDGSSYFQNTSSPSWTSTTDLMFFASFELDSISTTVTLFHGGAGGARVRLSSGDTDTRWIDDAGTVAFSFSSTGHVQAIGDRINLLATFDAANDVARCYVWDETDGAWASAGQDTSNSGNGTLENAPSALNLGTTAGSFILDGTVFRLAMWDTVADITQTSVQDNFSDSTTGALVDPATSRTAYGTPLIDLNGDAADYNAGTHDGSLSLGTRTGTFTDV